MNFIKETIKKANLSFEELIDCFEKVKENGNVAVIKFDGERATNGYTVFISFPNDTKREMIRADESSLKEALLKVLTLYIGDR